MAMPTRIANHPIHPMLVPFPIALWIFSFLCDLVYAFGWGGPVWSEMAFYSMAVGFMGALLAGVFGVGDYLSLTDPATIRVGKAHLVLNVVLVLLYLLNLMLRMGTHVSGPGTIMLSALGLLLLGVSGWLGGELVYVHGAAVAPSGTRTAEKGKTTAA
jgi:uncharacterized membrane protein